MKPQAREVVRLLIQHPGGVTSKMALVELGCARLASRIHELRGEGYNISSETVKVGGGAHVSKYRIV